MLLARTLAEQLARPSGWRGRAIGMAMDLVNRRPARLAIDRLDVRDGEAVIDLGCGTGFAAEAMVRQSRCHVTCVDRSSDMLRRAASRAPLRPADRAAFHCAAIEDLPFAAERFDAALALNVLYFCDPAGPALAEVRRVLRPGGRLVAYVTDAASMAEWSFVAAGHHRLYDRAMLEQALVAAGFARSFIHVEPCRIARGIGGLIAFAQA